MKETKQAAMALIHGNGWIKGEYEIVERDPHWVLTRRGVKA